jgi:hypothetical protein
MVHNSPVDGMVASWLKAQGVRALVDGGACHDSMRHRQAAH